MKCPYCGNEMVQGRILSSAAYWIRKGEDVVFFSHKSKEIITLSHMYSGLLDDNAYL